MGLEKVSHLPQFLLATLSLALAVTASGTGDYLSPINLRKAKGVGAALYNESTGELYAQIHYEEFSKRPSRIGFLKVGLPILTFHELSLRLEAKQANARTLLSAIEKTANSGSARYLFGENVTLTITDGKRDPIKLQAKKARFCAKGLRFFGGVELLFPGKKTPFRCESLYLKAEQETNSLTLVSSTDNEFEPIPLGHDSKIVPESTPAPNNTQRK